MDNALILPKLMSLHLLEEITNGFSMHRKLGGGAYGDVYLGECKDGEQMAVKVLKDVLYLDDQQFEKEYQNLARIHHKNVVQLIGYCNETKREYVQYNGRSVLAEKTKRLLCFEYMRNGSLDNFISDESKRHDWHTRYAIIKGMCEGLEYLHEKSESPLYHLDLKPANVLLDENMSPKIADFGLSRLFGGEKTQITKSAVGTLGYLPPEYIDAGVVSIKFDIFSLGVVIIKIMTGRDGYFRTAEMSPQQFIELVHTDWMNRLQAISVHTYSEQVRRCIEIALSCVEADRHKRPSIGVIVDNLKNTESMIQLLDASNNGSTSSVDQMCPCISNETGVLDILEKKMMSYQLNVTDNEGRVRKATITTIGDPSCEMSTFEPVKPRIKIIDCTVGLSQVMSIDAHPTKPWILVAHYFGHVSIWNLQKQRRVMSFHNVNITVAKFIEPRQCFVVGDNLGHIHVYSYVQVDKLRRFRAHAHGVTSLAVHPSEPFVLSASSDGLIKLWDAGWECIQTFKEHSSSVCQVRFNPQSEDTFASSSLDSTLKIWNINSTTSVATLHCKSEHLDYFIPSGDSPYLVTGSSGNAWIWNLQTNKLIKEIEGLQKYHCSIAVVERADRPILITVSSDRTVAFCDSTTHRYENRVNFKLGVVQGFAYIHKIESLAIGCLNGVAIMEIN